jgi:hypothetical protein
MSDSQKKIDWDAVARQVKLEKHEQNKKAYSAAKRARKVAGEGEFEKKN